MARAIDDQAEARRVLLKWQRSAPGRTVEVQNGLLVIEGPGLPRSAFPTSSGLPVGAIMAAIGGAT